MALSNIQANSLPLFSPWFVLILTNGFLLSRQMVESTRFLCLSVSQIFFWGIKNYFTVWTIDQNGKKKNKTKKTFLFSAKKVSVWTGHSSLLVIVRLLADTHILSLSHNVTKNNIVVKLLLSFLIYSEIKRKKGGGGVSGN